jgi:hypothetical protein
MTPKTVAEIERLRRQPASAHSDDTGDASTRWSPA